MQIWGKSGRRRTETGERRKETGDRRKETGEGLGHGAELEVMSYESKTEARDSRVNKAVSIEQKKNN
jgi:hypothetical protein